MQHADWLIALLLAGMALAILAAIWRARRGRVPFVRRIAGVAAIERAVERATEMGRPIVFGMGWTDLQAIETHASLAVLSHVARLAARLQTPLIVLARPSSVYPVAEEVVRQAYTTEGVPERFDAKEQVRFVSDDSIVYASSIARLIEETRAGCGLFFGAFDFTSLLMAEPGARIGVLQIAGDPSLFQIPFFVCTCDQTVMGEEYFAAGAYVSSDPALRATLQGQDVIKAIFAGLVVVGLVAMLLPGGVAQAIVEFLKHYH